MKTILTDDERNRVIDSMGWSLDAQERGDMHRLIQAVLAKLAQQEPVYAFRRRGLNDYCTCTKERYDELSAKPHLFEVSVFYPHPAPQQTDRQRVPAEDSPAVCDAYERIDRFLRNNLGDEDYADYSHDLDLLAIDYEALIKAAEDSNPRWAQGTMGCVAFKEGAEWYRAQVVAAIPDMLTRCRYDGHCQHAVNCMDEDQACPQGQCKHPKVKP
jgi:hypothetical protein